MDYDETRSSWSKLSPVRCARFLGPSPLIRYLLSICLGLWPFNIVHVLPFSVHLTFYPWPFNIFFSSFILKRYSNLIHILLGRSLLRAQIHPVQLYHFKLYTLTFLGFDFFGLWLFWALHFLGFGLFYRLTQPTFKLPQIRNVVRIQIPRNFIITSNFESQMNSEFKFPGISSLHQNINSTISRKYKC
jgi:hypothetical protein